MRTTMSIVMLLLLGASLANAATLEWQDRSDNEDGFTIEKRSGETFGEIGQVAANVNTFSTAIAPGETACFRVKAYNQAGFSAPSNEACATMPTLPNAPGDLKIKLILEFSGGAE